MLSCVFVSMQTLQENLYLAETDNKMFGKKTFKTYSRSRKKQQVTDDVFAEKALETLKENLSFSYSDGDQQRPVSGNRKRGRKRSIPSSNKLKKLKHGRLTKKPILQVKVQKRDSDSNISPLQDCNGSDVLFGEDLPPVKKEKPSRGKKKDVCTSKQKGKQKKNLVSKHTTDEQLEKSQPNNKVLEKMNRKSNVENKSRNEQLSAGSIIDVELLSGSHVNLEDKVSDWLAKSDECSHTSLEDTSKEVFRGAQNLTGDEMRSKLFPKEFYENLNCVLERRPSAQAFKNVKARQDEFLSQLALKIGNKQQSHIPNAASTEKLLSSSYINDEDLMIMCRSTQSELQTGLPTDTGSSKFIETQSDGQTGTGSLFASNTAVSNYTGTENSTKIDTGTLLTTDTGTSKYADTCTTGMGTSKYTDTGTTDVRTSKYTDSGTTGMETSKYTNTGSTGMGTSKYTNTGMTGIGTSKHSGTGRDIKTGAFSLPSETVTSVLAKTQSDGQTPASSEFITGVSNEDRSHLSIKEKHYKVDSNEVSEMIRLKDQRVHKYLCSTMRRSASLNNTDFPSELSAVTDSVRNQQHEEITPRKTEEDFKIPGSPTKCAAFKGMRKGILQPKNSTKLFTTGFVEIIDAIPQMSTIVCDNKSKVNVIENDEEELPCEPKQRMQNIKTSTPNKCDTKGQAFQFEVDLSSVNFDSGDEELHFHESREINSEECIQLSSTLIDADQNKDETNATVIDAENIGNVVKKLSSTTEYIKESVKDSPKTNKIGDLKRLKNDIVTSKVRNKRGQKTQKKIKSKVLRDSASKSSCSSFERVSSQFKTRRSCRISASNYKRKGSTWNTDNKDVSKVKECQISTSRNLRHFDRGENIKSLEKVQPDSADKDVYDIDNSDINMPVINSDKETSPADDDVFDIEESAINVPDVKTQKLAQKNYLNFKKTGRKQENTVKIKPAKRTLSDINFSPKGLLNLNTKSYSSMASRSLDSFLYVKRRNSCSEETGHKGSKLPKRACIAVCTLMDDDFICPQRKISLTCYTATDTRSREEILASVPVDSLML